MQALANASPDNNPHRQDEPYRRALTGIYARLAASLEHLTGGQAARHAVAPHNPYLQAHEFLGDLQIIRDSLQAHHGESLAVQRLHPLMRAVKVFGFCLSTVDLRQSTPWLLPANKANATARPNKPTNQSAARIMR